MREGGVSHGLRVESNLRRTRREKGGSLNHVHLIICLDNSRRGEDRVCGYVSNARKQLKGTCDRGRDRSSGAIADFGSGKSDPAIDTTRYALLPCLTGSKNLPTATARAVLL